MAMDLAAMAFIGAILEIFTTKYGSQFFWATPTITFGLLIVFLAVARWNLWGLLVVPIMMVANLIGGKIISTEALTKVYDWKLMLANGFGLATIGLNVFFYKKFTTKKCFDSIYKVVAFIVVDYLLYTVIILFIYNLLTSGNPFKTGDILYVYVDPKTSKTIEYNLCLFVRSGYVYNLFGLGVAIIGSLILRSQGALSNAKEKLIEDKKQVELNLIDREFRIQEEKEENLNTDDSLDTNESSKN